MGRDGSSRGRLISTVHHGSSRAHRLKEWLELRDVPLRSLSAGSFHCCALTTRGELYTFGHQRGRDVSNGNLLGHGPPRQAAGEEDDETDDEAEDGFGLAGVEDGIFAPRRVEVAGLGPIAEARLPFLPLARTVTFTFIFPLSRTLGWHPLFNPLPNTRLSTLSSPSP